MKCRVDEADDLKSFIIIGGSWCFDNEIFLKLRSPRHVTGLACASSVAWLKTRRCGQQSYQIAERIMSKLTKVTQYHSVRYKKSEVDALVVVSKKDVVVGDSGCACL